MAVVSTLTSDAVNIRELADRGYLHMQIQPLPQDSKREMCVVGYLVSLLNTCICNEQYLVKYIKQIKKHFLFHRYTRYFIL